MKITKEIIAKTAHLARLKFEKEAEDQIMNDLQNMVNWVDQLSEVDTEGVEPLTGMSFEKDAFREDNITSHLSPDQSFKNAPKHDSEYFRVPKVIK